jgi:hypothetical protein
MIWGLPSMARLVLGPSGLGPGLALQRRGARLRQLLRPAHAYSYRSGDLHEDAMQDLIDDFNLINHKQQMRTLGCISWTYSPR